MEEVINYKAMRQPSWGMWEQETDAGHQLQTLYESRLEGTLCEQNVCVHQYACVCVYECVCVTSSAAESEDYKSLEGPRGDLGPP